MLWHMIITKKKAGFYSNTSKGNTKLDWQLNHSDYIANFIAATPISLYFLAYLNFINTCSLYVLLNFPLPRQIYDTFSFLYNSDLFSMLGINPQVPQFTE